MVLVFNRKHGQRIFIGKDITVTILDVTGTLVRVGIDAPGDIAVHREEVAEQMERSGGPSPVLRSTGRQHIYQPRAKPPA